MKLRATVVAIFAAGCTCGPGSGADGGSEDGGAADAGGLALGAFCDGFPARICNVMLACGDYSDAALTNCLAREAETFREQCRRAAAGYLDYDPVAGQQCLTDLSGSPVACINARFRCGFAFSPVRSIFTERPSGCGRVNCSTGQRCDDDCGSPTCGPLLTAGAKCETQECVAALTCRYFVDAGESRCSQPALLGDDCQPGNADCGGGLYCDYLALKCLAVHDAGTSCTDGVQCADQLCRRSDSLCGALPLGASCRDTFDCGRLNICKNLALTADGGFADAGTCSPRLARGSPCAPHWAPYNFGPCDHDRGDTCLDGVCTSLEAFTLPAGSECPIRPFGEVGDRYFGFAACARGLTCQLDATAHPPRTGRCAAQIAAGAPCREELECGIGTCVSRDGGATTTCETRRRSGELCEQAQCVRELTCVFSDAGTGACGPYVVAGASCAGFADCAGGGICDYPQLICRAQGAGGAACTMSDQCISGSCDAGNTCAAPPVCAR